MSIQVNTGNAKSVNWEQILSSIGDVQKANSVDGKETFTIRVKEGGVPSSLTVNIPDDLELPDTVDSTSLQSLVDKLSASGVKFSDAQIVQIKDAIVKAYGAMAGAANGVAPGSAAKTNNAMFNLYALLALGPRRSATRSAGSARPRT